MYGGGPVIVREALDIYSRDLSKELTVRQRNSSNKKQ
jgi:hypothetical protein